MKHRIFLWLILVLLPVSVWAQQVPIGVAAWQDAVTGRISRAFGHGGEPTLNYQKADSTWDRINDDWVRVGNRQVWRSVWSNHKVYADSTGAAIYAKGKHYLGTKTTRLIKFNRSDSTWETIWTASPDSVMIEGNRITFHNIFPGINKTLENKAKVFRTYKEIFTFHQEARDSLATWGPWSGYLVGTVTRLNVDSLNLSWKDASGIFGITNDGRMTDGWIKAMDGDTMVFGMAGTYLRSLSDTGRMAVKKRMVLLGGVPYLIELFDPIEANQMFPTGALFHAAQFGDHTIYGLSANLENKCYGGQGTTGATGGTMDSIVAYLEVTSSSQASYALYEDVENPAEADLYDSTARSVVAIYEGGKWYPKACLMGYTVTASTDYALMMTSKPDGFVVKMYYDGNPTTDDSREIPSFLWEGEGYGDNNPATINWADWGPVSIYGVYTEPGVAAGQVIIIGARDEEDYHNPRFICPDMGR